MAPIRYSLHYEDYSEHIISRFGKLLQTQSLVDMTLMCNSHTLRVHKAVLAASSAYFQDVLQKQTGEPLIILKMRFGVMKCLVEFMYCGKTQCPEEHLDELVSAAQFLKIKGLSKVTKEGLGIKNSTEVPVFTPPVVINRPPQSLIDLHSRENTDPKNTGQDIPNTAQAMDNRHSSDTVVRIPFDIENKSMSSGDYVLRSIRPRRGKPSMRHSASWEGSGMLGRAAERALMRREQDSREAIHHLKNLQSRQMQDYMDRTLTQAVSSICEPESNSHNYINMDTDLMYMDQPVSSNMLDPPISYTKEGSLSDNLANYSEAKSSEPRIGSAMSQYVNALKNAGLPTDLPILFESGDGSYINVNEQVLLDMVQSSEIQYEVIEQPNIIEKVADPSEIKSIDDLSKSIESGKMLMGSNSFDKNNIAHEDAINSLNSLLPDSLESFSDNQNYTVMDSLRSNNHNSMSTEATNDFSCIENEMQYFTKSMSDDVKKYYQDQQLNDPSVDPLCPVSSSLDSSFSMSLLDTKSTHLGEGISQRYSTERNDDYDFSLQLSQNSHFKEEGIDCLISPRKPGNDDRFDEGQGDRARDQDEIIKDLMDFESTMQNSSDTVLNKRNKDNDNDVGFGDMNPMFNEGAVDVEQNAVKDFSENMSTDLDWDKEKDEVNVQNSTGVPSSISSLNDQIKTKDWVINEEKYGPNATNNSDMKKALISEDIPFAVGLQPLKSLPTDENNSSKRKIQDDTCNVDAKCLKRKVKHKIM